MVKKIVRYIVDFVIWRFHCTSYCHNFKDWHYLDCGQSLITITFFSHKRSRAEEKYLKFAAFYFLNFTWLCHGSFRLCRTYGGMHVNWKSFFYYSRAGCLNFFQENAWKTAGKLWSRSHVSFCLKKDFFSSSLACRLHVSGKNGLRKRLFSRTLSKVEIFDDAVLLYSCGWMETEVHEKRWRHGDGYQLMRMFSSKLVPFSIAIAFFLDGQTIQERNVWTRIFFFENGENNFRFQTNTNTWGRGLGRERHILTLVQWNLHVRPPTISYHLSKTPKLSQSKPHGWNLY